MNLSNSYQNEAFTDVMGRSELNINNDQYEPHIDRTLKIGTTEENSHYTEYIDENGETNREAELKRFRASTKRIVFVVFAILLTVSLVAIVILAVLLSNCFNLLRLKTFFMRFDLVFSFFFKLFTSYN